MLAPMPLRLLGLPHAAAASGGFRTGFSLRRCPVQTLCILATPCDFLASRFTCALTAQDLLAALMVTVTSRGGMRDL